MSVGGEWGGDPWPISLFVLLAGLVTLVSVLLAAETFQTDLTEERAEERRYVTTEQRSLS